MVLSRKKDEKIIIGNKIVITVVDLDKGRVKLGIEAPSNIEIHREEVYRGIEAENREAVNKGINLSDLLNLSKK